jgi:putative phosphoribosyl transferase
MEPRLSQLSIDGRRRPAARRRVRAGDVSVLAGSIRLPGTLVVPPQPSGLVVFAHGSGSSRNSPRNRWVADYLNESGFSTLLFDLLTPTEQAQRSNVFDIERLGHRLAAATRWVAGQPDVRDLPIGYFGASTGAAAALWAAAESDLEVRAVVSRGGRPDLAEARLARVLAPTLLIVGGLDTTVLTLNWRAARQLRAECRVAVVPGATHLFEETGTLRVAAGLADDWFASHLVPVRNAGPDRPARERASDRMARRT